LIICQSPVRNTKIISDDGPGLKRASGRRHRRAAKQGIHSKGFTSSVPPFDAALALERANARWRQLVADRPALSRALELQRHVVGSQIRLAAAMPAPSWPGSAVREAARVLAAGQPAFTALPEVHMHGIPFETVLLDVLGGVADAGAGRAAEKIRDAVTSGDLDLDRLLTASLQRSEAGVRRATGRLGLNLPVTWYAAEVVTAPLAGGLRESLLAAGPEELALAVGGWLRPHCFACGSAPAFAEIIAGDRVLRCTYCSAAWTSAPDRCVHCGAGEERQVVVPDSLRPGRRLELCRRCRGYLKTLDMERLTAFPLLTIEDLGSSDLDTAAAAHGYRRQPIAPDANGTS
jgi:FdhE protein